MAINRVYAKKRFSPREIVVSEKSYKQNSVAKSCRSGSAATRPRAIQAVAAEPLLQMRWPVDVFFHHRVWFRRPRSFFALLTLRIRGVLTCEAF